MFKILVGSVVIGGAVWTALVVAALAKGFGLAAYRIWQDKRLDHQKWWTRCPS